MSRLALASSPHGPPGSWTAPFAHYTLSESGDAKWGGVAVAQGTHTAVFGGSHDGSIHFFAVALPTTSGSGTPAPGDYVACVLPFITDYEQSLTAYKSPNTGDAMAVIVSLDASTMAVVDSHEDVRPDPRAADRGWTRVRVRSAATERAPAGQLAVGTAAHMGDTRPRYGP